MYEAIARIERDGDPAYREHDPLGRPDVYLNGSVPGVMIRYRVVDDGATFVLLRVWPFFVG